MPEPSPCFCLLCSLLEELSLHLINHGIVGDRNQVHILTERLQDCFRLHLGAPNQPVNLGGCDLQVLNLFRIGGAQVLFPSGTLQQGINDLLEFLYARQGLFELSDHATELAPYLTNIRRRDNFILG